TVSSVTGELEEIISGVEKSADAVSDKVKSGKEKLAEQAEDAADEIEEIADDAEDAAIDAAERFEEEADEDYDVDEEIRQAMMEDEAGMALPFKLRNPFKKKSRADGNDAEPAEDLPEDADDFADEEKGSLFGGISLKNPFKKKDNYYDDEEFDEDDQDYDDMDDEEYDDEYDEEERHVDLGKIALILTFVILGIFAIDFARRLIHDWRSEQGDLVVQSHDSSQVESMNADVTLTPAVTTGLPAETTRYTIEISVGTTTATVGTDVSGATTVGTTFLDKRPTETLAVPNENKRSGSLTLIDNDHQQAFTPNLLAFNQFPIEHLRMVSPVNQKVDAQLAAPLKNMFNDFFNATGIGNVLVYNTTDTPAYPPYSVSLPERSTGLTLDFAILNEAAKSHAPYTPDGNYAWLTEHACDYGFIVRYPTNKSEKTGMDALTWHFRYVGAPHAKYMYDNDLCLEEYLDTVAAHPWNSQHLTATVAGITYEMYYVPASETTANTEIPYPVNESGAVPMVSGDNINGFVVAVARE
ncbi:MAG: D-alanyl-D-alanine carboxypeptidase family protein, partial [Oscillospiraceae bacterium]|nr:D-alanyl-D-alanine carboxypeptidase family protein [Oscillospiraceae bacterium]